MNNKYKIFNKNFSPAHINANKEDFLGNNGVGRYCFIPGSRSRAEKISKSFSEVQVKRTSRGHDLYKGKLLIKKVEGGEKVYIDVCSINTGMGDS